jgi:hypothetical protein
MLTDQRSEIAIRVIRIVKIDTCPTCSDKGRHLSLLSVLSLSFVFIIGVWTALIRFRFTIRVLELCRDCNSIWGTNLWKDEAIPCYIVINMQYA